MKTFSKLISKLELSNKTNDKLEALVGYFEEANDVDKTYVIALFTGKKPKRSISAKIMRALAIEKSKIPSWLFQESYQSVGDLSETIALLLPPPSHSIEKPLHLWMEELDNLSKLDDFAKIDYLNHAWDGLDTQQRFVFNKLISGNFRIGVSHKMLVNALAKLSQSNSSAIMHSIMGKWNPKDVSYQDLLNGKHINSDQSWPYPFCLAHPLENSVEALGNPEDWQAEWKWDGIRGQIVKRNDEVFIWSRGEELVSDQFPELMAIGENLPNGTVLDGEILALIEGKILPFSTLQQRLNRKIINKKQLLEVPVGFFAYDILEEKSQDLRNLPFHERRSLLKNLLEEYTVAPVIQLSDALTFTNWSDLATQRARARAINSEGLMLKHQQSVYHSGRKRGDWWKWKIDPYSIDAVMIYAQKGSGRRANYYTDYTFAVNDGDQLVTIAKAYSGLTDKEIKEINTFVNKNALEKFGPVKTVKPELVFEIAFEGIAESKRHKSGIALRFPRILRWRKDKSPSEINSLQDLQILLKINQQNT